MKVLMFLYLVSQAYAIPKFHDNDTVKFMPDNPSDQYVFEKCGVYHKWSITGLVYGSDPSKYLISPIDKDGEVRMFVGCNIDALESELSY